LPTLSDGVLKREYLNYLKWTEPIALMLALVEDRRAVQVVQLALDVDWRLGARLAGEVKPEFQEQTVGYVRALDVPVWLKVQHLRETRSDSAIPGLLKLVEDSDYRVRCSAANALGYIGSERAIPALLKLVEDSEYWVHRSATDALGEIAKKNTEAITQYLPHLLTLIPTDSGKNALSVILAIQENCKFYNYEIWQEALSRG